MGATDNSPHAHHGPANPQAERTCRRCAETKPVSPETWVYRKGREGLYQAHGMICLACEKSRKAEYEAKRDKIAALVADVPAVPAKGRGNEAAREAQREAVKESKLDVAKALKAGGKVLNEYAPAVLARILQMFEDEGDPQHAWAVQFLADRILPRKLYEEIGGEAAGLGLTGDRRPQYTVQVIVAQPEQVQQAPHRIIEGTSVVETVEALPKPE